MIVYKDEMALTSAWEAEQKLNKLEIELEGVKVRLALLEKMALERTEKPSKACAGHRWYPCSPDRWRTPEDVPWWARCYYPGYECG